MMNLNEKNNLNYYFLHFCRFIVSQGVPINTETKGQLRIVFDSLELSFTGLKSFGKPFNLNGAKRTDLILEVLIYILFVISLKGTVHLFFILYFPLILILLGQPLLEL